MSSQKRKPSKPKHSNSGVATASFSPGHLVEFIDTGNQVLSMPVEKLSARDRRKLKQIEGLLKDCVNIASVLERKQAGKFIHPLREVHELVARLAIR